MKTATDSLAPLARYGGLLACTCLVALVFSGQAFPVRADDGSSDSHTVSINSGKIQMIDVLDEHPDDGNRTPADDPTDTDEEILISFDPGDVTAAGDRLSELENEETGEGDGANAPWLVWTANVSSRITVCNESSDGFSSFTEGDGSRSWLTVAGENTVLLAEGPNASPEPSPSAVLDGTSCGGSLPTLISGISGATGQRELDFTAEYDVVDGHFPDGDTATVKFTIEGD